MRVTISKRLDEQHQEWHSDISLNYANQIYLHARLWQLKAMLRKGGPAKWNDWKIEEVTE